MTPEVCLESPEVAKPLDANAVGLNSITSPLETAKSNIQQAAPVQAAEVKKRIRPAIKPQSTTSFEHIIRDVPPVVRMFPPGRKHPTSTAGAYGQIRKRYLQELNEEATKIAHTKAKKRNRRDDSAS